MLAIPSALQTKFEEHLRNRTIINYLLKSCIFIALDVLPISVNNHYRLKAQINHYISNCLVTYSRKNWRLRNATEENIEHCF
jgi:hypothetical protein